MVPVIQARSSPSSSRSSTSSRALAGRTPTWSSQAHTAHLPARFVCCFVSWWCYAHCRSCLGFFKWYSLLYRNQGSLLFGPPRFDWGNQIVVVTGGTSFLYASPYMLWLTHVQAHLVSASLLPILSLCGTWRWQFLISIRLSQRTVSDLHVVAYFTRFLRPSHSDNINYYKCDVSKWEQVQAAAEQIRKDVSRDSHLCGIAC